MDIDVQVVNAFSLNGAGGNPAGIVFGADNLTQAQKQQIGAQVGFPETAFVSSSDIADFKLEFFTPVKQIPHCGHATIATFSYLKQTGKILSDRSSKETIDGCRSIVFSGDEAYMEQRSPTFHIPEKDIPAILKSLGINTGELLDGLQPTVVNTGNSFLIVPVQSEQVLNKIVPDQEAISLISEKLGLIGYYVFTHSKDAGYDATTRMFAPFFGIEEESATGMAAGPLATYLYEMVGKKKTYFQIEQGRFMTPASPSLINVNLEPGDTGIARLYAGGNAYRSGHRTVSIE